MYHDLGPGDAVIVVHALGSCNLRERIGVAGIRPRQLHLNPHNGFSATMQRHSVKRVGVDEYIARGRRRQERRRRFWLWFWFVFLIGLHVLFYVYFSEIVAFVQSVRDAALP
ncbi:MAG: hypothetical protein ACF8MF_06065 [Phycisphaerales bacterium JB052]